ncbi:hypothetical protein VUR80DRAFT_6510 [Thermomyces stellatus]
MSLKTELIVADGLLRRPLYLCPTNRRQSPDLRHRQERTLTGCRNPQSRPLSQQLYFSPPCPRIRGSEGDGTGLNCPMVSGSAHLGDRQSPGARNVSAARLNAARVHHCHYRRRAREDLFYRRCTSSYASCCLSSLACWGSVRARGRRGLVLVMLPMCNLAIRVNLQRDPWDMGLSATTQEYAPKVSVLLEIAVPSRGWS